MARPDQILTLRPDIEKAFAFSQAVVDRDFLFVSGCVSCSDAGEPLDSGDFRGQVQHTYGDIQRTLRAAGLDFADVVKETVFTLDIEAMAAHNDVRAGFYGDAAPPASTWVQVARLVDPVLLLEVEVIARRR